VAIFAILVTLLLPKADLSKIFYTASIETMKPINAMAD
jgi:hypothetical protein